MVLKVTDFEDEAAVWFGRWCRRHQNLHWPRFYRQVRVGRSHILTWMERLHPLDRRSMEAVKCVDEFVLWAGDETAGHLEELAQFGFGGKWQGCPKRLRQPVLDCIRVAERFGLETDHKHERFMRRPGGILVMSDPFQVDTVGKHSQGKVHCRKPKTCIVEGASKPSADGQNFIS